MVVLPAGMLASKVLDGISDVIFGTLIDRTHSKLGKARPWMLFGRCPDPVFRSDKAVQSWKPDHRSS